MQQRGDRRYRSGLRTRSGRRCGRLRRAGRALLLCVAACALLHPGTSRAAMTGRIGGDGGAKTQRVECNYANAFLTSFTAKYIPVSKDFYVLRAIRFSCIVAAGSEQGSKWTLDSDVEAAPVSIDPTYGPVLGSGEVMESFACSSDQALYRISAYTGSYVDAIDSAGCRRRDGSASTAVSEPPLFTRPGRRDGTYRSLTCPSGQALYRIDARVGSAVDSLQGYCRTFPPQVADPNAPVFDAAPAQGSTVAVSAVTGGEIALRAHGVMRPVTMSHQVSGPYASRFALATPLGPIGTGTAALLTTSIAATTVSRVLRVSGPVPVSQFTGAPLVPVTITVRDGAGRTTTRFFNVYLR
jgi:hypothetical protein